MLRTFFLLGLAAAMAGAFAGCKKDTPPPPCYAGRVVVLTCTDGLLLDVDPAYPIGAPAVLRRVSGDSIVGRNVIAVVNTTDIARLATVGLTLLFNYVIDPARHSELCCLVFDGSKTSIPHMVVSNVSTTICEPTRP